MACVSCQRQRGFVYTVPVYALEELAEALCPWCIADGTAAARFDAEFTDVGFGVRADVPRTVIEEVSRRTPGFVGWQQEYWLYHCRDATAFTGPAGHADVAAVPEAIRALEDEARNAGRSVAEAKDYIESLRRDAPPTAYLFKCLHCGIHLAYSGFHLVRPGQRGGMNRSFPSVDATAWNRHYPLLWTDAV